MSKASHKVSSAASLDVPRPAQVAIAARAYQIYLERGCQHGHDVDDWLQAEYELVRLPVRKLAEIPPTLVPASSRRLRLLDVVQAALL